MKNIFIALCCILMQFSSFALTPITGPTSICTGSTANLRDTTTGGTWTCSNTAIATIGLTSGTVTGISVGTATITYTLSGVYTTAALSVSGPVPAAITGLTTLCVGSTSTLSDATPGGVWSSSIASTATVGSTGIVTGVHAGGVTIDYTTGACSASVPVTVYSVGARIKGPSTVCLGATIVLTDSTGMPGSTAWSSSNTAIATVSSGGVVTGIAPGVATISVAITGSCGTSTATMSITVSNTTSTGTITGATSIYTGGATTTLSDATTGGTWSSSNPSVGSVDPTTGIVTGIAAGTTIITYTVSGCGGSAYTTCIVSVSLINGISGQILFTGSPYYGSVKVWLITYNSATSDLEAVDSATVLNTGTSVYYQFLGAPTDSFRIKAYAYDTFSYLFTTGYMPTYHNSSFYWYSANVLYHTSGTADINKDITMLTGTPTAGPGFIGGNVTTGANKGSTGGAPAIGLRIYALNSSGAIAQQTITDATGKYTFSNLPVGMYTVFPEDLNYLTTAYTSINITSSATTFSVADFIQHTVSHTITPIVDGIKDMVSGKASVFIFPNPSGGKLNLQWNMNVAEKGTIIVSDATGRQVFTTAVTMNEGAGAKQIDLSDLAGGLYLIHIKSPSIDNNTKIEIQK